MKRNKISFLLAMLLTVGALSACNPVEADSNPFHESESESETEVVDVDRETAQVVIDMIDALTDESTKEEIMAVYDAYEDLTPRQKSFVTNYEKLLEQVEKIEILDLIDLINSLIDALDVANPDEEDVALARSKYNELLEKGEKWSNKISPERLNKLKECETIILKRVAEPLIATLLNIDSTTNEGGVQFKLLSRKLNEFLSNYSNEEKASLNRYQDYVNAKEVNDRVYEIATDHYISTTHNLPAGKAGSQLEVIDDDAYGYAYYEDLTGYGVTGPQNIQFATKADFSEYKRIAFFVSWPIANIPIQFIQEKESPYECKTVHVAPESGANVYRYVEISVSSLLDPEGKMYSTIGGYLEDRSIGMIPGYKITDIVGIGIDPVAAQAAVDAVDAMIEALDSTNPDRDAVAAAREAYNALATTYSIEWQQRVKPQNVAKLIACEETLEAQKYLVINELIQTALSIQLDSHANEARFNSIASAIDKIYSQLTQAQKDNVVNYSQYVEVKEELTYTSGILFNRDYYYVDGANDVKLNEQYDEYLGSSQFASWPNGKNGNMVLKLDSNLIGENWTSYKSIGFFVRFSHPHTDGIFLIPNNWTQPWVPANRTLIDASTNLYYYEYELSSITGPFTHDTYFQVYFHPGTGPVVNMTRMEVSPLVAFKYDTRAAGALIAKINSVDTSTNKGLTQFVLLQNRIELALTGLSLESKNAIAGYSDYASKKSTIASKAVMIDDGDNITTYEPGVSGDWPMLRNNSVESSEFGYFNSHTYQNTKTGGNVQVFYQDAKGKSWANYSKLGLFFQIDSALYETSYFADGTQNINATTTVVDEVNHIYYLEVDFTSGAKTFSGNPFICINLNNGGQTKTINITNVVGII